jgi:hypothetical protein
MIWQGPTTCSRLLVPSQHVPVGRDYFFSVSKKGGMLNKEVTPYYIYRVSQKKLYGN